MTVLSVLSLLTVSTAKATKPTEPPYKKRKMSTHRFILEPYKGIATRHSCPKCHKKRCFARYIDTEGKIEFPSYVGRCNHEQSCGYHFTPKEYFEKNPTKNEAFKKEDAVSYKKREMSKPLPTSYIDENIMRSSQKCYETNNLFLFLTSQFGETSALSLMEKYHVGTSKHWNGATVFWQVDNQSKIRTGKVMLYNPETGKRVKEPYNHVSWVHSLIPHKEYNLSQCFFGEHLINEDRTKPIALVESEKTALIASYYLPQFLWIASGGKNGCFNAKSLSVLRNRDVVLFPDLGATAAWKEKQSSMKALGIRASLFDFLEQQACEEDKAKGLDIADYLLKIKPTEARLQALIKQNPAILKLIDTLKLVIVDEPQPRFRPPRKSRGFRL